MRKRFVIIIFSFIGLFASSCGIIKPVTLKGVNNFNTVNSGLIPEFRFDLSIYNPNKFSVKIEKLDVGIFVDTLALAKTVLLEETEITKLEATMVTVAMKPAQLDYNNILNAGLNSLLSGSLKQQFSVNGEIKIRKFIFKRKYKFSEAIKF